MDLFDFLLHSGLITAALVAYLILFRRPSSHKGIKEVPGWNYPLKYLFARFLAVKLWKTKVRHRTLSILPRETQREGWDSVSLRTSAPDGSTIILEIRKLFARQTLAEVTVHIKLTDGTTYKLPRHPDTAVGSWVSISDGWSAGGLKIQVLESENHLRILYNGMLTRDDGVTQHANANLIWTSASDVVRYPEDWSDELAATALAHQPWSKGNWDYLLGHSKEGSWLQWGAVQGRLQTFNANGSVTRSEYLRTRGVRERRWVPRAAALKRCLSLTLAAADGTTTQIRTVTYDNASAEYIYGSVRFPNTRVNPITYTNLNLPEVFDTADAIPNVFTFNVGTNTRDLRIVVRPNNDGGRLYSGVPYQFDTVYRTVTVDINGEAGTGVLELGYTPTEMATRQWVSNLLQVSPSPAPVLRCVSEHEAGPVGYCVSFQDRAAACTNYVGGKGASLALLTTVQAAEGYRVPSGFCITVKALEEHLKRNPILIDSIKEIEAANENYEESYFKDKCTKTAELFVKTEIAEELTEEILSHLTELRKITMKEDLGPERRFAVRSSAVGEDSEALSAAGQNETVLGCVSDSDVIKGVQKCWASMFAFTSVYYRRQNGQPCLCGGGIVVQAMVNPRVAGVMFTRHPAAGDCSRLLITANYGLGESVVSGAVEPDTFIVSRSEDGRLSLAEVEIGSKSSYVTTVGDSVGLVTVSEDERKVACLGEGEVLRLAQIGVAQEQLWGAGRDIEWAIYKDNIYLVQARPITSLERWSEEELLHELDSPIMADDELTTFANCGEVFPKPVSPLSHDLVLQPLMKGMMKVIARNIGTYEETIVLSHNRCMMSLYNSVYRRCPPKIDINIRMLEMAIHGHKVATDAIMQTAVHRRPPHWTDKIDMASFLVRSLFTSKFYMSKTLRTVNKINIDTNCEPAELLESIQSMNKLMSDISANHAITSGASTSSQFIAMAVLMEGGADFTPEQCNEISALLSSGDVLSAEVPQSLSKIAREIDQSDKASAFREQDPLVAMDWLKENMPEVYTQVSTFLEQHGHRAIMEFDMLTKPWALVPEELMKILQNLKVSREDPPPGRTDAEIIASLQTPRRGRTRRILAWVLPICRRTVRHRESTKAYVILGVHKLRLAAIELGKALVKQWYLPHPDLVFFFRVSELSKFIQTRDPALLRKAIQRQQYYPAWSKLKFAELNTGWVFPMLPRPIQLKAGDVTIEGTSVCGGEIVARACVVNDLSEIGQLKQGDILITHATDIGWSPYFPLLAGIVTELGGLISHGAVIAREYGLPCIVGATGATDVLHTGDWVRLSGSKGTVEKVQLTEPMAPDGES